MVESNDPWLLTIPHGLPRCYSPAGRPCWRCGGQQLRLGHEGLVCLQCGAGRHPERAVGKPTRGAQV